MRSAAGTLLGLLLLVTATYADEVRLVQGEPLTGAVREAGGQVHVNPYGSTLEGMTWGVVSVPSSEVEAIVPTVDTGRLLARLEMLPWQDVAGRTILLGQAEGIRARKTTRRIAAEILRIRPDDTHALEAFGGGARWTEKSRGDPRLDPGLGRAVASALREVSSRERQRILELLGEATGWAPEGRDVERMARSLREPRGTRHDVRLTWADAEGATASLYVPEDLHPLDPRPLVLALHGGMTARGEPVLGTGRDAFALFETEARRRGWLLVAPSTRTAPWSAAANAELVEAVLAEVGTRYAVDLERVYLVGQGAGADGALALEGRMTGTFAAVGAAGAAKPEAARGPTSRRVGVWLYHGDVDEVVPVAAAREAAEGLLRRGADFVYAELPGMGHGLPAAAEQDLARFLARHRRPRARDAWPRSSLVGRAGTDEVKVLGDPGAAWRPRLPEETAALLDVLRQGRPEAEAAARALADRGVAAPAIVADRAVPTHGRAWAAWLCGRLRAFEAIDALTDAVRAEADPVLRRQAARALRRLGVPEAATDLAAALEEVSGRFARTTGENEVLPFDRLDTTCRLLAAIVEAYAVSAPGEEAGPAIESHAVLAVLGDRRPVRARADLAEDPVAARAALARSVGRAYATLDAEPTLMALLRVTLKKEPRVLEAAEQGHREGVSRDR